MKIDISSQNKTVLIESLKKGCIDTKDIPELQNVYETTFEHLVCSFEHEGQNMIIELDRGGKIAVLNSIMRGYLDTDDFQDLKDAIDHDFGWWLRHTSVKQDDNAD